jgi:hypothetical protein
MTYAHSAEAVAIIDASADALFNYLDDQQRLGSHMQKPSMMMMGGRMTYDFDEARGRAIGSAIKMGGSVMGLHLSVEEVVVERQPPVRKAWETRGQPRLLVIGKYLMGFEISPFGTRCRLRVFIEYDHPSSIAGRILAWAFAPVYARWCVGRMAQDGRKRFEERDRAE